jgi:hypothetical protein
MTEYHKDQAVKIWVGPPYGGACKWRKAKIIELKLFVTYSPVSRYEVEFDDGTRAIVTADNITLLTPPHRE